MSQPLTYGSSLAWLGQVMVQWRRWTAAHWRMTLLISAIAFVFGWVWNTYIMAVDLEGSVVDPDADTIAMAEGRSGNALFWLLLFSLAGGVITYAWSRGWRSFLSDLAALPRQFGSAVSRSPAVAFAMLLWGMSISLIIATLISSAVSFALGLVLLALAATPVGVILNFALVRLWRALYGIVAPKTDSRIGVTTGPFMVMLGEAIGLFLDWMFGSWVLGLVLGILCAVASLLVVRLTPTPQATALIVFFGIAVAIQVLWMHAAYADDGGWSECVSPDGGPCTGLTGFFDWLRSPGADVLIVRGAAGGLSAAVGAALGVGTAAAAAGLAAAGAQASPMTSQSPDVPRQAGPAEAPQSSELAEPPTRQMSVPPAATQPPVDHTGGGPQGTLEQAGDVSTARLDALGLAPDVGGDLMGDAGQFGQAGSAGSPDVSDLLPEQPDRKDDDDETSGR
jgi:hypothetical protein